MRSEERLRWTGGRKMTALLLSLVLTGCAQVGTPKKDEMLVLLRLTDNFEDEQVRGVTECNEAEDFCVLTIRRDTYPFCFVHGIRYSFEGEWHDGANGQYCRWGVGEEGKFRKRED